MAAFLDSYSFAHRFTDDKVEAGEASWQEVNHQCQGVNALALTRVFFHFAIGCGFVPASVLSAFQQVVDENGKAYGYDEKK